MIYNNIDAARAEAKRTNKPLFVTFRCVPCHACKGFDAYNSIASLEKTMRRVLALHEDYPNNKNGLAGKLGKPKPYKTALEMPSSSTCT